MVTTSSTPDATASTSNEVFVNIYDLIEQNSWAHWAGLGVYHSGVQVYGVEYAFGGHELDAPGVFATHPRAAPGTVAWREAVLVGTTALSPAQVYDLVQDMGREYKGNRYHLLQMNCNTFSEDLCKRLTGVTPPSWVNRLANIAVSLHCLLPQGWVPPLRPPTAIPPPTNGGIGNGNGSGGLATANRGGGDDQRRGLLTADHLGSRDDVDGAARAADPYEARGMAFSPSGGDRGEG